MQEHYYQKYVGAPVMDISDQLTEGDILLQVENRFIGPAGKRLIHELEHQAGAEQKKYQHCGHTAQPPCQAEPEGALRHHPGTEMEQ